MAVCDAKYKFTLVDIGDTGVMAVSTQTVTCVMLLKMVSSTYHSLLSFPQSERILPYVFIGHDAFGLKNHLLKPYPFQHSSLAERVFNYTSSRARRVIENAFGLAASRFRVLHRPVIAKPNTVISITKSIVALHNFLMSLIQMTTTAIVHLALLVKITLQELLRVNGEEKKETYWDLQTLNI